MAQLPINTFKTVTFEVTNSTSAVYTAPTVIGPANDAHIPMDGKLVLETGDEITITAGANSSLKLILSILETANA